MKVKQKTFFFSFHLIYDRRLHNLNKSHQLFEPKKVETCWLEKLKITQLDSKSVQCGLKMRRKKSRSIYSFQITRPINVTTNIITITANTIVWTTLVSLCCLFTYVSCDDAAFNSKLSTFSGHVKSTTPMQPELFTNHSAHMNDEQLLRNQSSSSSASSQHHKARTFVRSGNELWDGLVNDCLHKPSFSCFQKNIYTYLDDTLRLGDVNVTDRILFKKIDIDPNLLGQLQNTEDDDENEVSEGESREFKSGWNLNIHLSI